MGLEVGGQVLPGWSGWPVGSRNGQLSSLFLELQFPGWSDRSPHASWSPESTLLHLLLPSFLHSFPSFFELNGDVALLRQEWPLIHPLWFLSGNAGRGRNPWHARTQRCHGEFRQMRRHFQQLTRLCVCLCFFFLYNSLFFILSFFAGCCWRQGWKGNSWDEG